MIAETIPALDDLDPEQKLLLASELWDSVADSKVDVPVSEALLRELDRRLEEYRKDPSKVSSWEDAKQRIRASRG